MTISVDSSYTTGTEESDADLNLASRAW